MKNPLIVLMTDFGNDDIYVGVMKGIINRIAPEAKVIDLTHKINSFNIQEAAFKLFISKKYFDNDTIFLSIVDPGVGSNRKPIAIYVNNKYFIAPDNGLLTFVIKKYNISEVFWLNNHKYFLTEISSTFHGRDVFAPIAAHLAKGINLDELGQKISIENITLLDNSCNIVIESDSLYCKIMYIDKFGNIITSVSESYLTKFMESKNTKLKILVNDYEINGLSNTYDEVELHKPLAYLGSFGYLEIGIREANAYECLLNSNEYSNTIIKIIKY